MLRFSPRGHFTTNPLKNSANAAVRLDKLLFEAGQQCLKRLYLDFHSGPMPGNEVELSESRRAMAELGQTLVEQARSAFPGGIEVQGATSDEAAAETAGYLQADETMVLFGAAFVTEAVEARADIVLRQKNGELDVFEVKSGTRVKARHVSDLALQVYAIEASGFKVRAIHVLHLDRNCTQPAEGDVPPTKLFRSADVTARVRRVIERTADMVESFRRQIHDDSALQLPTGTFCQSPFRCPHLEQCARDEPAHPLRMLPELSRQLENTLHAEGIDDLTQLDEERPDLTFRQRRTLQAVQQQTLIVEPFVGEELRNIEYPLHFIAIAQVTEAMPRFAGMRPWQYTPYAWGAVTIYEDGESRAGGFAFSDKGDPRPDVVRSLSKHIDGAGMIIFWGAESLASIRSMLEALPTEKQAVRAILARPHLDLAKLLESGLFDAHLPLVRDLPAMAHLVDRAAGKLTVHDDESTFGAIERLRKPRSRVATKQKAKEELHAWVTWQAETLVALHERFSQTESS